MDSRFKKKLEDMDLKTTTFITLSSIFVVNSLIKESFYHVGSFFLIAENLLMVERICTIPEAKNFSSYIE